MNKRKQILEEDAAKTYNEFKVFEGKKYTGMRVGGRHKWYYEKGRVEREKGYPGPLGIQLCGTETACRPCPAGSGVPIGTEYHWYILAHQNVRKLDENTYSTAMTGLKYKLARRKRHVEQQRKGAATASRQDLAGND